jgi:endonuclease-8
VPEGDTVWLTCRRLHAVLAGRALVDADLRVPKLATVDLRGVVVDEVVPRGKHQLFRLGNGWTLHTHLRMDGTWRIGPAGEHVRGGAANQIRVVLNTGEHRVVGFRLPVVELVRADAESTVVGHLGPDLLGPDWDAAEALRRLLAEPERSVGEALLDQRNLAGVGTLYRAETLFLAGVHPRRPVAAVGDLGHVVGLAHRLLRANIAAGSYAQVTTGNSRRGQEHWVFERTRQPCRRCGTPIRSERFGPPGQERLSYWCPSCQPGD